MQDNAALKYKPFIALVQADLTVRITYEAFGLTCKEAVDKTTKTISIVHNERQ